MFTTSCNEVEDNIISLDRDDVMYVREMSWDVVEINTP